MVELVIYFWSLRTEREREQWNAKEKEKIQHSALKSTLVYLTSFEKVPLSDLVVRQKRFHKIFNFLKKLHTNNSRDDLLWASLEEIHDNKSLGWDLPLKCFCPQCGYGFSNAEIKEIPFLRESTTGRNLCRSSRKWWRWQIERFTFINHHRTWRDSSAIFRLKKTFSSSLHCISLMKSTFTCAIRKSDGLFVALAVDVTLTNRNYVSNLTWDKLLCLLVCKPKQAKRPTPTINLLRGSFFLFVLFSYERGCLPSGVQA